MALPLPQTFRAAYAQQRAARMNNQRPRRTPLLVRAGRLAARALPTWQGIRRFVLSVGGFGCMTAAAWQWSLIAGLVALGASLLILEALTGGDR